MVHTDEKQKENEQQSQSKGLEYIVSHDLKVIDEITFYKLESSDKTTNVRVLFIELDKIVLSPNLALYIENKGLLNNDTINIIKFDEKTFEKLYVKDIGCIYSSVDCEVLFPDDIKVLNDLHSGTVMKKMDTNLNDYEVKLDKKISIDSIDRVFKKIFVLSNGLLNGFNIKKIKIQAMLLFNVNHDVDYEKPLLYSCYADKKDLLSTKDYWVFRREKWFYDFNEIIYTIMFYVFIGIILISIIATSFSFSFNGESIFFLLYSLLIVWLQYEKRKNKIIVSITNKSQIEVSRFWNIIRTLLGLTAFLLALFFYSSSYTLDSKYVYDSKEKKFLEKSEIFVTKDLVFRKDKILERYIFVKDSYMIDLVYQIPNSLLSFSNKYIDLEINFVFKKGDFLLGSNIKDNLSLIRGEMQRKLSLGYYGDLSSMNDYDYRKIVIVIEEDIMKLLALELKSDKFTSEDIVKSVKITTKYAKLQNVEK